MANSAAAAALASWTIDLRIIAVLVFTLVVYWRGWRHQHRTFPNARDYNRLICFAAGLLCIFIAIASPLDTFDSFFLSAHMTQHLLLMMVAPPLLLLGDPVLPMLYGLPKGFVKEGLGPFITWPPLRRVAHWLTSPILAWLLFNISTLLWHVPVLYETVLHSSFWHAVQHACFFWTAILFWWVVIEPGPVHSRWPQWIGIPYLLLADLANTILAAIFIFSGEVLYPSYQAIHTGTMTPLEDQAAAGAIMWVPGSIVYLVPATAIAVRMFSANRRKQSPPAPRPRIDLIQIGAKPVFFKAKNLPRFRRVAQVVMLLVAVAVIADGFWGPQVGALNMAGVLPWTHWRMLSAVALLTVGNFFCMSCPFTLVRDMMRKLRAPTLRWPHYLRNKWLPVVLLVLYFWVYEAFSLWDKPWATAAIIVAYFFSILIIDGLFRDSSFCKYVCPIGQFHFFSSLISPREVAIRKASVCESCTTYDCIRGNEQARGCELHLFQPKKTSNLDCTFCMDCIKACPHDNVTLRTVAPAKTLLIDPYRSSLGRLSKRTDMAVLMLILIFGAFTNAAGMIAPVMMWEHGLHAKLGPHMMPAAVGAFVLAGTIALPAAVIGLAGLLTRMRSWRRFVLSLVPIGFAMWFAHLLYHFVTGWSQAVPVIERAITGAMQASPMAMAPDWLTGMQLLVLDAGLLLSLYLAWKIAKQATLPALFAPWAIVAVSLYLSGAWILFQPMEMRGMVH